jgi:hypothetical protein
MKAFTLSNTAWHFRLANYGATRIWVEDGSDICEYTRAVFAGSFLLLLAVIAGALATVWVGLSLFNLYEVAVGAAMLELHTALFLFVMGIIGFFIGVAVLADWYNSRPEKPPVEPGFVKLAYRKFKNKTCVRLEFK